MEETRFVLPIRRMGLLLLGFLLVPACAGVSQMKDEPLDRGELWEFDVSADKLAEASRRGLESASYDISEEQDLGAGKHVILATIKNMTLRVVIAPVGPAQSTLVMHNTVGSLSANCVAFRRKALWFIHLQLTEVAR
jgi:hypothetical protein